MSYDELVAALRCANDGKLPCDNKECPYWVDQWHGIGLCNILKKHADAADAIEALQAEIRESMQRCAECGDELAHQMPKRGEIVRCGECAHCYAEGFAHERNICEKHPELGNVPDDWFCADGEREVQE